MYPLTILYTSEEGRQARKVYDENELAETILETWNLEGSVIHIDATPVELFNPYKSDEENEEVLKKYGIGMKEDGYYRRIYNIETNEFYYFEWE